MPQKKHLKMKRTEKIEVACDNAITQIRDITRETISRGVAVRLIGGTETKIDGQWFRGTASGDIFRATKNIRKENVLAAISRITELRRVKVGN